MLGVQLVLMALFGFLGYREAAKFEREHGRAPFGVPAWGWAAITGMSLIIGAVLLAVARRQAAKASTQVAGPVWTSGQPAPLRADLWAAPVPAQPVAPSVTSRDILPGR